MNRLCSLALSIAFTLLALAPLAAQRANTAIDFSHEVTPILKTHCVQCHGGEEAEGGFSINTRSLLLESDVVVSGDAKSSRLYELITSDDPDERMPPADHPQLTIAQIETLARWIDQNTPWEPGFTFGVQRYEPPLRPRLPELPSPSLPARDHPVDRIIDAHLNERESSIPLPISDAAFLRRVQLDVLGKLPTVNQLTTFVDDTSPTKRQEWIDRILQSYQAGDADTFDIDYAEHWLTFWNDLLRNAYTGTGFITGGRKRITPWLYRSLLSNKPYDELVRELISPTAESEGFIQGIRWRGTVNSSQTIEVQFAQNVTQSFLGINMKCASCHDSFIDRWTLEETYALASIYSDKKLELHRCDKPLGKTATAGWMFPELGQIDAKADKAERLKQLADLFTDPNNGRFTRTIANRIWHRLMGRGIVHPVDAMQTRPWNEDLLDYLAHYLAKNDYDLRKLIGFICSSQAYQSQVELSDGLQPESEFTYHGPRMRRMTAEQFVDAVWQITGSAPTKYDAKVSRFRAVGEHDHRGSLALADWIWSSVKAQTAAAADQRVTFSYSFDLPHAPVSAVAVISCDNEFTAYVNGSKAGGGTDWTEPSTIEMGNGLKAGKNRIIIVGKNGGEGPNPAGLFAHVVVRFADGATQHIRSGDNWQWTPKQVNKRGAFKVEPDDWKPAVLLDGPWGPTVSAIASNVLAHAEHAAILPVRASLTKNNDLMQALGRPHRDQIVTSRPDTLTTLEAIDLANGQRLFDWIKQGVKQAIEQHSSKQSLVNWLFRSALSRQPTKAERATALEMLGGPQSGDDLSEREVQDLMWAVLMMPEFQFVR